MKTSGANNGLWMGVRAISVSWFHQLNDYLGVPEMLSSGA